MKSIALTSISRENRDVWPPLFVVPSKPINLSIYKRLYQFSGRRVRHILAAVPIGHHCINSRVYYRWNSLRGGTCRCQADTDFHSTQKAAHTHTHKIHTQSLSRKNSTQPPTETLFDFTLFFYFPTFTVEGKTRYPALYLGIQMEKKKSEALR